MRLETRKKTRASARRQGQTSRVDGTAVGGCQRVDWRRVRRAAARTAACLLIVLVTMRMPGTMAVAVDPPTAEEVAAPVKRVLDTSARLRASADDSTFDYEALSLDLALDDADEIVSWVEDEIAFQPYPGLLRGALGTLRARAGNALDQSVLLAGLLKDAGYEAKILEAEIEVKRAEKLVLSASMPTRAHVYSEASVFEREARQLAVASEGTSEGARRRREKVAAAEKSRTQAYVHAVAAAHRDLLSLLDAAGVELGGDATAGASEIVGETLDYFWVAFRPSAAERWVNVHPAHGEWDAEEPTFTAEREFTDTIPQELQHRIRIQAFVDVRRGTELLHVPITSAWERPAANLNEDSIDFTNFATGYIAIENGASPMEVVNATEFFFPMIDGSLAPGAKGFTPEGFIVDPMAANTPQAGVFQTMGGAFDEAAGAVGSEGRGGLAQTLVSESLQYTLVSPGGRQRTVDRVVVDRSGPRRDSATADSLQQPTADELLPLLDVHSITVLTGGVPSGYAIAKLFDTLQSVKPAVSRLVKLAEDPSNFGDPETAFEGLEPGWTGADVLRETFSGGPMAEAIVFRAEPTVFVGRRGVRPGHLIRQSVDILWNNVRGIAIEDSAIVTSPDAVLRESLWESMTEGSLDPSGGVTTQDVLDNAIGQGIDVVIIDPSGPADVPAFEGHEQAKNAIERELDEGYLLVLPAAIPDGMPLGWWRVDPGSGNVLGMVENENDIGGGTAAEYLIFVSGAVWGVKSGVAAFMGCTGDDLESVRQGKIIACSVCALIVIVTVSVSFWEGAGALTKVVAPTMLPAVAEEGAAASYSAREAASFSLVLNLIADTIEDACNTASAVL